MMQMAILRTTADKREIRNFPKFAFGKLQIPANCYMKFQNPPSNKEEYLKVKVNLIWRYKDE